jgi:hypothetical protein
MKIIIKYLLIWMMPVALLLSSLYTNASPNEKYIKTDIENLAFKQEIYIPIATNLPEAKYQPVDINVEFINPCWAKDEKTHSVRVGYDNGSGLTEIESQIYNLEHSDDTHITSCSLVFLIPEVANGKEKYFVLYDESETKPSEYKDHVVIEDTHYFYEPISGQKIDFDYYRLADDGYVVYMVIQKGELLGNPVSQSVGKFKPGSTEVETYNLDQLGSFDMRYGVYGEPGYDGTSCATEVSKSVIVDGNLMARMRIEGSSPKGDIKTDNIYTYYYCPGEITRIIVNAYHEVIETINIEDPEAYDGSYASVTSIKSRSATIEKMNAGEILPTIVFYDENDNIEKYDVPMNPESQKKEYVLSTNDDADLGKKAWVCLNDPSAGKAHGLILESNTGINEKEDGVQIKAFAKQNVKLPGLEVDTASLFLQRNTYEKGGRQNTIIPQGFVATYNIELITVEKEGYQRIDKESEFFQQLIKQIPEQRENVSKNEKESIERFSLTTYVHFAPSVPLGSLLSAALGKNLSYINAELYKEQSFKSSGTASRLSLGSMELDLKGKKIIQQIKTVIVSFDWKNASLFKKIKFPDLEPGIYLVKIFRENPLFAKERQYIGFAAVEINKDTTTHIYCRSQGKIEFLINDQNNKGVENVKFSLYSDNVSIAETISDDNGSGVLKAPCYPTKPYTLKVMYQGFLVEEKNVKLGFIQRIITLQETFSMKRYKLTLKLKDTWGFAPAVEVNPTLTSKEMIVPTNINAEKKDNGEYSFSNLYPANYVLSMSYKSFDLNNDVKIDTDKILELSFHAEYKIDFNAMNSYGDSFSNGEITVTRSGKNLRKEINKDGTTVISVPPGEYEIKVTSDHKVIAKQKTDIKGDKKINIITSKDSFFHSMIMYIGVILAVFSIIFMFWKNKIYVGAKILIIALLIIALVSPWWVLNGSNESVSTTTKTLLIPAKIVSLTESSSILGGGVSQVPDQVTMILSLLSILLAITCLIMFVSIFTKNKFRKTTIVLSILSFLMVVVVLSVFFYAMSQITEIGVGSFSGSGDIETALPGTADVISIPCSWGPGLGFYLSITAAVCLVIVSFLKRKTENRS